VRRRLPAPTTGWSSSTVALNDDQCAGVPRCDPATGACTAGRCDGALLRCANLCTTGESCQRSVCGSGTTLDCNDSNRAPSTRATRAALPAHRRTGSCWGTPNRRRQRLWTVRLPVTAHERRGRLLPAGRRLHGSDVTESAMRPGPPASTAARSRDGRVGSCSTRRTSRSHPCAEKCPSISGLAPRSRSQTLPTSASAS
jgi:hypothetical protein